MHTLGLGKLVDFAADKTGKKFFGECVVHLLAYEWMIVSAAMMVGGVE